MIAPIEKFREPVSLHRQMDVHRTSMHRSTPMSLPTGMASDDRIASVIGRYPVVAVTTSAVIGIAIGWFVKRKWNG